MVSQPSFTGQYLVYCRSLRRGTLVTGEDIRVGCEARGISPHHPNAWGAAANHAVKQQLLIDTGQRRQMRLKKSHARRTPLYRIP